MKQYTNPLDTNSTLNMESKDYVSKLALEGKVTEVHAQEINDQINDWIITAKVGSRMLPKNKANVFSEKRRHLLTLTTVQADHKWEEVDKIAEPLVYRQLHTCFCQGRDKDTKMEEWVEPRVKFILDFIHSQLSKAIKERDEEWKKITDKVLVRFDILLGRFLACEQERPDTHRVSLREIPDWQNEMIEQINNLIKQGE